MPIVGMKNRIVQIDDVRDAPPLQEAFERERHVRKELVLDNRDIESAGLEKNTNSPRKPARDGPQIGDARFELPFEVLVIEQRGNRNVDAAGAQLGNELKKPALEQARRAHERHHGMVSAEEPSRASRN